MDMVFWITRIMPRCRTYCLVFASISSKLYVRLPHVASPCLASTGVSTASPRLCLGLGLVKLSFLGLYQWWFGQHFKCLIFNIQQVYSPCQLYRQVSQTGPYRSVSDGLLCSMKLRDVKLYSKSITTLLHFLKSRKSIFTDQPLLPSQHEVHVFHLEEGAENSGRSDWNNAMVQLIVAPHYKCYSCVGLPTTLTYLIIFLHT